MRKLYPAIDAAETFTVAAAPHRVYAEVCGNSRGIPAVFLHGGPGSGCKESHRCYFDPERYRVVLFDQRGCHRSTPVGECRRNTLQDLLADMETIRERCRIPRWLLFGGSWGATLALAYAQQYPEKTSGMILRGTFLARQQDLDWFADDGAGGLFPDEWRAFKEAIPEAERGDLIAAYYQRLHSSKRETREQAAAAWDRWAARTVLSDEAMAGYRVEDLNAAVKRVKIETHYAKRRYFLKPNQLLENARRLPAVPTIIIHGDKDRVCLPEAARELHRALPGSELRMVAGGGHLAGEPAMTDALITATDEMAERLQDA